MRPSVRAHFLAFTAPLEGVVDHFYLDIRGLVTIGHGLLVDPVDRALGLPMIFRLDGRAATRDEIRAEWEAIKASNTSLSGHTAAREIAALCLLPATLDRLALARLDGMAGQLSKAFDGWASWPASAQLTALSMVWALGTGGLLQDFPRCCAALRARDWLGARDECEIDASDNAGVIARNAANRLLLEAAAHVEAIGGDPDALLLAPPPGLSEAERRSTLGLVWATADRSVAEGLVRDRRGA